MQAVETPGRTVGFLAELRLHPNQTEWILSRVQRNDCLEYGQDIRTNPYCAHDLFVSQAGPKLGAGMRVMTVWGQLRGCFVPSRPDAGEQSHDLCRVCRDIAR